MMGTPEYMAPEVICRPARFSTNGDTADGLRPTLVPTATWQRSD
jgi:hypothetical protein